MSRMNPTRSEELLGTKRAIDQHRWASDPERTEALVEWTAKAVEVLLREQVERNAPAPSGGEER